MYESAFHNQDLSTRSFLVTGGAGFIGSHIVEYLIKYNAGKVLVVDDLSTGNKDNIVAFLKEGSFEFHQFDINETEKMTEVLQGIDYVMHQAALGSVPRSIEFPLATHHSNATGFLSVLEACRKAGTKRLIYASSSSVYGDSEILPKEESVIGNPKSPYAISKLMDEYYAQLYGRLHQMEIIGLRYFNIFGPRQNPEGPYAAAIPLFILAALNGERPRVFGDGNQTRDFTFVENAVQANIKALFADSEAVNKVFNIACGGQFSLNELLASIGHLHGQALNPEYLEKRTGDILHSNATIELASEHLDYHPFIQLEEGLKKTMEWYAMVKG